MIRFVICDDEASIRKRLKDYILRLGHELNEVVQVLEFTSGQQLLNEYPPETDILLLDIKMEPLDGLAAAQKIRAFAPEVCIIFITSMVQYALYGYQVRAFGFLPKPVFYARFREELSSAIGKLKQRHSHYILVSAPEKGVRVQVNLRDILYFEVRNHAVTIQKENESLEYRGQLKTLEAELDTHGFFRCHTAYLVNQRYIQKIEPTRLQLTNGCYLPISKQRRRAFLTAITKYVGDNL